MLKDTWISFFLLPTLLALCLSCLAAWKRVIKPGFTPHHFKKSNRFQDAFTSGPKKWCLRLTLKTKRSVGVSHTGRMKGNRKLCSGKRANDAMLTSRSRRSQGLDGGGTFQIQKWKTASHTFIWKTGKLQDKTRSKVCPRFCVGHRVLVIRRLNMIKRVTSGSVGQEAWILKSPTNNS